MAVHLMLIAQLRKRCLQLADIRIAELECNIAGLEMRATERRLRHHSTAIVDKAISSSRRLLQKAHTYREMILTRV